MKNSVMEKGMVTFFGGFFGSHIMHSEMHFFFAAAAVKITQKLSMSKTHWATILNEQETYFQPVSITYFSSFQRKEGITVIDYSVTLCCNRNVSKETHPVDYITHTPTPTPYLSTLASQNLPCPFQTRQHDNQPFSPLPPYALSLCSSA